VSKWTKFKNKPVLFFKDMVLNAVAKPKPKPKTKPKNIASFNYNMFYPYTHLLHTGENVTGLSHLDLWISYFKEADVEFVILVRNFELFELLKEKYPYITVLFAKGKKEVETYFKQLSHLKACFYPSNTGNNLHLLHHNHIKHIFIGHGDSDKTASAHKYFRVYDENWVAGEAHIDRFYNAGFDFSGLKNIKVGRPSLKEILQISEVDWRERFDGKLNLLYLSTWEGVYEEQNYTSVSIINTAFDSIYKYFDEINIKLHPWVGRREENLLRISKILETNLQEKEVAYKIAEKHINVDFLIKKANIFICDISAVITDSLAANAPIFVYIPKGKDIKLSKSKMGYEDYTYVFSNIEELVEKMEDVLNGNDYLKEKREEAMEYILGRDETLNDEFISQLQKLQG